MGIGESLAGAYSKAEESFYNFADWLDEKGIPVYSILTPMEENGIPAFPVVIAIVLLIFALLFWFFVLPPSVTTVKFIITDDSAQTLNGVTVRIVDDSAKEWFNGTKSHGDTLELKGVPAGTTLRFT
jgi:hypothetical protein